MWPFRTRFGKGLAKEAAKTTVGADRKGTSEQSVSISLYELMIEKLDPKDLGRLTALILAQAESDGASRVRLCFGKNAMFYTLAGVEHEMVPPPSATTVDIVRALAHESGCNENHNGNLVVTFSDKMVELEFAIRGKPNDEYLDITGFSGAASGTRRISA